MQANGPEGKKIVVVEDDDDFRDSLLGALSRAGYEARGFGSAGAFLSDSDHYDLAIIDVGLPDNSGFAIVRSLSSSDTRTIILSGRDSVADRVEGYTHGADIYMVKPTPAAELLAAISSLLKHRVPQANIRPAWSLDEGAGAVISPDGQIVPLNVYQFNFVKRLLRDPGQIVGRDELQNLLGIGNKSKDGRALDMFVVRLRQRLKTGAEREAPIETVKGQGFLFKQGS